MVGGMTEPGTISAHIEGGDMHIDAADDTVLVQASVLGEAADRPSDRLRLDSTSRGDVLVVTGVNRTVRYRLADPDDAGARVGTLLER